MTKQPRRLIQERLRKLADLVEKSKTFDQAVVFHACGTPADVAGHVVAWLLPKVSAQCAGRIGTSEYVIHHAQKLLELSDKQAEALFDGHPYLDDDPRGTSPATSEEAAAVLRRLADTGEVDWRGVRMENA